MNDLNTLLDGAAGPAIAPVDVGADLTRGHRALSRTRRRRAAAGLAGLTAAGVVGAAGLRASDGPGRHVRDADPGPTATSGVPVAAVVLRAAPVESDTFRVGTVPDGWVVQGDLTGALVLVPPAGGVSAEPTDFRGKLVVMFDANSPAGNEVTRDGRSFFVHSDSGYTTVSTRTPDGQPQGTVHVQYPDATGWSTELMLQFIASVEVRDGASKGLG
jgi:hypothetical protein